MTQKEKGGNGGSTTLGEYIFLSSIYRIYSLSPTFPFRTGKYHSLNKKEDGSFAIEFRDGDHCWGIGEARKADVTVICGKEGNYHLVV